MSKKLSKKLKWVIPFAVLSVTCMSVGIVSGCKKKPPVEEHTHAYEWKHDNDEHWKECPADGAEEEGTRGEHVFVAGECECGATETVVVKKYGKVTGTVKLHKLGGYETDFTDVTVDMGDEVQPVFDKTTGTFTIDEVEVDKYYSLTVSKPGYQSYAVTVQVPTEDETVTVGGERGIILEYEVFGYLTKDSYDKEFHDFSHANDANPYVGFKENDGTKTMNVISNASYTDVAATMRIDYNNSLHGMHTQGIVLRFEDGKHVIVRYHNGDQLNGNIQYVNTTNWAPDTADKTLFGEDANLNEWGENPVHTLTAAETAAIKKTEDGGLDLTLVLSDGKLTVLFDGKYISEYQLPEGYADKKAQVGYFAWNAASNAIFTYGISTSIPDMQTKVDIDVTQPDDAGCTVTATPEKQKYAFGEEVELTVTAASGYMLSALTVNGEDKFSALNEGKLTLLADRENIEVAATFVEKEDMALNLTVKGKKLGQTTALAAGTKVSLSGISEKFTVNAEGKITADTIAKARYTISVDGYFAKDIILDENLTEVVLEYDTFYAGYHKPGSAGGGDGDNWDGYYGNPDKIDKSHVNDADPYFTVDSTDFYQYTNDKYSDVVASITVKSDMTDNCPTVGLVFEGNKAVMLRIEKKSDGNYKVQWIGSGYWLETAINGNWDFGTGEEFYNPISNTLKEKYVSTGLKLSLMRKGDTVYAFVDDVFVAKQTITGYADKQCSVMFAIAGVKGTQNIPFDISSGVAAPTASVTDKTTDTNGTVTLSTTTAEVGTDVTVKVEPNDGYIIGTVKVNGVDVTDRLSGGEYTFTLSGDTEVEATFEEIVVGSINAEVSGKKLGVTGNSLSGDTQVVLTSATAGTRQATLSTVEGKTVLKVDEIVAGKWTVKIEGYIAAEIEVAKAVEYTTAISLEYDTFSVIVHDRELHDFSNVNNLNSTIKVNGSGKQSFNVISQDKYDAVCVTINTQSKSAGVIQGILLKFEDGNYAIMNIKTDQSLVQYRPGMWGMNSVFGSDKWVESAAGTVTQSDIDKFNGDGVVLKLVRTGGKMYTFVDGRFVHVAALPEGYEDDKVQVGFFAFDVKANAEWAIDISETFPALTATVTNETAQDAHGTVTGIPAEAVTLGDEVTVTVTPDDRYKLAALTVNGVDVTSQISGKDYTFTVKGATTVTATFEEIIYGTIEAEITGKKLGVTDNAIAAGTEVTLTAAGFDPIKVTAVDKEGVITLSKELPAATWTVKVEGYFTTDIIVKATADGEYNTAIALEYDLLENLTLSWGWGDKADLSKQNDGKIQQLSGKTQWVSSKDSYNTVAISASLLKGGGRQGVFIRFGDKYAMIQKENNDKISWNGEGNLWGNGTNILRETWTEYVKPLDMDNNEYVVTLVREANRIFVFVNGDYYDTKTLADEYADVKCNVGIYCTDCPSGERTLDITEDVSEYRKGATVTAVAGETQGSVEIENAGNIKVGDTVTVTVIPVSGKFVESFKVGDEQVRVNVNGETGVATYELLVTDTAMTVSATFVNAPAGEAEASVSGAEMGNIPMEVNGKTLTFKPESGLDVLLTVKDNKVKGKLVSGSYKVSLEGCYDINVTVGEDGTFENLDDGFKFEKILFVTNGINEPEKNIFGENNPVLWSADNTHAASTGKIVSDKAGKMYEWSVEEYKDVAFTVTLKNGNGNQGLIMRFGGQQKDVRLRFEGTKAQWIGGGDGGWWWGSSCIIDRWDFGSGENYANNMSAELLEKYNGTDGLKLTIARKGAMVYALIDGKVFAAQNLGNEYATKNVRLCYFAESSTVGYEVPFVISADVDALLAANTDGNSAMNVLGKWTVTDTTLAVTGDGYLEFAPTSAAVKESLAVTLKDDNSTAGKKAQGVVYRFADGTWIAARMETSTSETYIQYADDMILPKAGGTITGWALVKNFDKSLLTDGVSLKMVRDGKAIYVLLGDEVIDVKVLDDKYATMDGAFAATIESGTGNAFAYEYKTGDDVTVPAE